jgi:hypothetical protein
LKGGPFPRFGQQRGSFGESGGGVAAPSAGGGLHGGDDGPSASTAAAGEPKNYRNLEEYYKYTKK